MKYLESQQALRLTQEKLRLEVEIAKAEARCDVYDEEEKEMKSTDTDLKQQVQMEGYLPDINQGPRSTEIPDTMVTQRSKTSIVEDFMKVLPKQEIQAKQHGLDH